MYTCATHGYTTGPCVGFSAAVCTCATHGYTTGPCVGFSVAVCTCATHGYTTGPCVVFSAAVCTCATHGYTTGPCVVFSAAVCTCATHGYTTGPCVVFSAAVCTCATHGYKVVWNWLESDKFYSFVSIIAITTSATCCPFAVSTRSQWGTPTNSFAYPVTSTYCLMWGGVPDRGAVVYILVVYCLTHIVYCLTHV